MFVSALREGVAFPCRKGLVEVGNAGARGFSPGLGLALAAVAWGVRRAGLSTARLAGSTACSRASARAGGPSVGLLPALTASPGLARSPGSTSRAALGRGRAPARALHLAGSRAPSGGYERLFASTYFEGTAVTVFKTFLNGGPMLIRPLEACIDEMLYGDHLTRPSPSSELTSKALALTKAHSRAPPQARIHRKHAPPSASPPTAPGARRANHNAQDRPRAR